MILQEHVLQMMSNSPPEGWEEQMLKHEDNAKRSRKQQRIHRKKDHNKEKPEGADQESDESLDSAEEAEEDDASTSSASDSSSE